MLYWAVFYDLMAFKCQYLELLHKLCGRFVHTFFYGGGHGKFKGMQERMYVSEPILGL